MSLRQPRPSVLMRPTGRKRLDGLTDRTVTGVDAEEGIHRAVLEKPREEKVHPDEWDQPGTQ